VFEEIHPPLEAEQALIEARRCLQCGGPNALAPCVQACPTEIDVPRFIGQIAEGRPAEAAETIFSANPLGGTCARVCPVEIFCEHACVLSKEGRRPIEIARLQRYATDISLREPPADWRIERQHLESVGVVGAGPAGLACASELAHLGYLVTVYDKRVLPGGLVSYGIAPYKQMVDPIPAEVERLRDAGVRFQMGVEVGRDISVPMLMDRHEAVFLATGTGADMPANLPGEDLSGIWNSLEFIEWLKMLGPNSVRLGRRVVVIGGGNTAIDVAREAVRLGSDEVTIVYRRCEEHMPAYRHEIEAAKREGVKILELVAPLEFLGRSRVQAVRCVRMQLGAPDRTGRPRPEPLVGSEFELAVDGVIKAIGQQPLQGLAEQLDVAIEGAGIRVDSEMHTNVTGVFAGGDCLNGGATVVEAVRDGIQAARSIHSRFSGEPIKTGRRLKVESKVIHREEIVEYMQGDHAIATSIELCKGCDLCVSSCPAGILHLDHRSKIVVDDIDRCVFCGLCEARCPDFAIWMVKGSEPAKAGSR
jgi:glutamate synthase (NADPH/NADH) small chain